MNPFDIFIPSAAHIPSLLSTIFQVLTHTIAPSLLCHWFIVDLVRKATMAMKTTLEFYLSPTCAMPLTHRAKVSADLLSCSFHLQLLPGLEDILVFFPSFLVRYRLHNGPKDAWEQFDYMATQLMQGKSLKGVSKHDILDVMKVLCSETWDLPGNGLRVRNSSPWHIEC